VTGNHHSQRDRTGAIVTAAMLALALIGAATVFHGAIAAVLTPSAPEDSPAPVARP